MLGVDISKVDKSGYVQDGSIPPAIKWHHLYYPKLSADRKPIEFTQEVKISQFRSQQLLFYCAIKKFNDSFPF